MKPDSDFLGDTLLRKLVEALRQSDDHAAEFAAFDKSIRDSNPDTVEQWGVMIEEWEKDSSKPCPYLSDKTGKSYFHSVL